MITEQQLPQQESPPCNAKHVDLVAGTNGVFVVSVLWQRLSRREASTLTIQTCEQEEAARRGAALEECQDMCEALQQFSHDQGRDLAATRAALQVLPCPRMGWCCKATGPCREGSRPVVGNLWHSRHISRVCEGGRRRCSLRVHHSS